jgi:putative endopeptidase
MNDFDEQVNGEWKRDNIIPGDQTQWGSFQILLEENRQRLKTICETDGGTVGLLYRKFMSVPAEVSFSVKPLFDRINTVTDINSYLTVAGELFSHGIGSLFHICKSPDDKEPELNVPHITQSGLGLPDMSYYADQDRAELHKTYTQFIADICMAYGYTVDAANLFRFECQKAKLHLTRVESRVPERVYNKVSWSEVYKWCSPYFDALQLPQMTYCIVQNVSLMVNLQDLLSGVRVGTLRDHLIFSVARSFAQYQTDDIVNLNFNFYGKLLAGQVDIKPRWKRALETINNYIGDELGKMYVSQHFKDRAPCINMAKDIKEALQCKLKTSDWMSDETKRLALLKLSTIRLKIGYPDKCHSTEGLWPDGIKGDMCSLALQWGAWDWREQECNMFYTKVDKELWHMRAYTVNAYYDTNANEMVFPAGILQKPFYGYDTYEENVGAIGVIIGHEMTHGYDDRGSQYNHLGELNDWWTKEDRELFSKKARVVVDHYNAQYYMGKPVNGELTLSENIADIGGVKLAIHALQQHYESVAPDVYDRFFRAYATMWRELSTEQAAHQKLIVDSHAPPSLRINSVLSHIPEFYSTYHVSKEDKMYLNKDQRMTIW